MFKLLFKGVSAFLTIMLLALTAMPPTEAEKGRMAPDSTRMDIVQMRLARAMISTAPDFFTARYAEATGAPPEMIRAQLEARANGALTLSPNDMPAGTTVRAGGAKFIGTN